VTSGKIAVATGLKRCLLSWHIFLVVGRRYEIRVDRIDIRIDGPAREPATSSILDCVRWISWSLRAPELTVSHRAYRCVSEFGVVSRPDSDVKADSRTREYGWHEKSRYSLLGAGRGKTTNSCQDKLFGAGVNARNSTTNKTAERIESQLRRHQRPNESNWKSHTPDAKLPDFDNECGVCGA